MENWTFCVCLTSTDAKRADPGIRRPIFGVFSAVTPWLKDPRSVDSAHASNFQNSAFSWRSIATIVTSYPRSRPPLLDTSHRHPYRITHPHMRHLPPLDHVVKGRGAHPQRLRDLFDAHQIHLPSKTQVSGFFVTNLRNSESFCRCL